jgi:hypothetical protein
MDDLPLTPGDLRAVADALEPIEFDPTLVANPILGRIEVFRPDGDDQIGWFQRSGCMNSPADDWLGFVPLAPGEVTR